MALKPLRHSWSATPQLSTKYISAQAPFHDTIPEQDFGEIVKLEKNKVTVLSEPLVSSCGAAHETS